MKTRETEPFAFGLIAGLMVFWFAMVIACMNCSPPNMPTALRPESVRQSFAAKVEALCVQSDPFDPKAPALDVTGGYGSAVVLGGRRLLTANHVVACNYLDDIHVVLADGHRLRAHVEKTWPDRDLARLVVYEEISMTSAPIARKPPMMSTVCEASAYPKAEMKCGLVGFTLDKPGCQTGPSGKRWCWDIQMTMDVIAGNSGSGMYDDNGNLVGIVTGGSVLAGDLGFATSLWDIREEVTK